MIEPMTTHFHYFSIHPGHQRQTFADNLSNKCCGLTNPYLIANHHVSGFYSKKKKRGGGLIRQMRSLNKQQRHCWPISMGLGQMWRKETRKLDNKEEDPFMFKRLVLNRSRARRTGIAIELVNQFFLAIFSVFRWATNSGDEAKLGNV